MLEIEQKYANADFGAIERQLAAWGVTAHEDEEESDAYFNAPDRDFKQTDEAFRLRRIGVKNFLTYKGPKRQATVKIRTELEVPLPDGDAAANQFTELLKLLGYRYVATVAKRRRTYRFRRDPFTIAVCLDEVVGLGRFAEVEIVAPEEQKDAAYALLTELGNELSLRDVERRSYLGLVLNDAPSPSGRNG
jgi:adenylate cyclase class 2